MQKYLLSILLGCLFVFPCFSREWHVCPNGYNYDVSRSDNGTVDRPLNLETVLEKKATLVKPGDIVWLHAYNYPFPLDISTATSVPYNGYISNGVARLGPLGRKDTFYDYPMLYTSDLKGNRDSPIIVRAWPPDLHYDNAGHWVCPVLEDTGIFAQQVAYKDKFAFVHIDETVGFQDSFYDPVEARNTSIKTQLISYYYNPNWWGYRAVPGTNIPHSNVPCFTSGALTQDSVGRSVQLQNAILTVLGEWTEFWDFEVRSDETVRLCEDPRDDGIYLKAPCTEHYYFFTRTKYYTKKHGKTSYDSVIVALNDMAPDSVPVFAISSKDSLKLPPSYTVFDSVCHKDTCILFGHDTMPPINTGSGVNLGGDHIKLFNLIIHDNLSEGVDCFSSAIGSEIQNCLIYNNGHNNVDRSHGHGIYTQNNDIDSTRNTDCKTSEVKIFKNNILFHNAQINIKIYSKGDDLDLRNYKVLDNIAFNAGSTFRGYFDFKGTKGNLWTWRTAENLFVGNSHSFNMDICGNHLFYSDFKHRGIYKTDPNDSGLINQNNNLRLGETDHEVNDSIRISYNSIIGGSVSMANVCNTTYHPSKPSKFLFDHNMIRVRDYEEFKLAYNMRDYDNPSYMLDSMFPSYVTMWDSNTWVEPSLYYKTDTNFKTNIINFAYSIAPSAFSSAKTLRSKCAHDTFLIPTFYDAKQTQRFDPTNDLRYSSRHSWQDSFNLDLHSNYLTTIDYEDRTPTVDILPDIRHTSIKDWAKPMDNYIDYKSPVSPGRLNMAIHSPNPYIDSAYVHLDSIVPSGRAYRIRDAQQYHWNFISGTYHYGDSITIPMPKNHDSGAYYAPPPNIEQLNGYTDHTNHIDTALSAGPDFGAFVVEFMPYNVRVKQTTCRILNGELIDSLNGGAVVDIADSLYMPNTSWLRSVVYKWTRQGNSTWAYYGKNLNVPQGGLYKLEVITPEGFHDSAFYNIELGLTMSSSREDTIECLDTAIFTLHDREASDHYRWWMGTDNVQNSTDSTLDTVFTSSTSPNLSIMAIAERVFRINDADSTCITDTASLTEVIDVPPTPVISPSIYYTCPNGQAAFQVTPDNSHYVNLWITSFDTDTSGLTYLTDTLLTSTSYDVRKMNQFGCLSPIANATAILVSPPARPQILPSSLSLCGFATAYRLYPLPGDTTPIDFYEWGDSLYNHLSNDTFYDVGATTKMYRLRAFSNSYGCASAWDSIIVTRRPSPSIIINMANGGLYCRNTPLDIVGDITSSGADTMDKYLVRWKRNGTEQHWEALAENDLISYTPDTADLSDGDVWTIDIWEDFHQYGGVYVDDPVYCTGCHASVSVTIHDSTPDNGIVPPDTLVLCPSGTVVLNAHSTLPYQQFDWYYDGGSGASAYSMGGSNTVTVSNTGLYYFETFNPRSSLGCTVRSGNDFHVVKPAPLLIDDINLTYTTGSAVLDINGTASKSSHAAFVGQNYCWYDIGSSTPLSCLTTVSGYAPSSQNIFYETAYNTCNTSQLDISNPIKIYNVGCPNTFLPTFTMPGSAGVYHYSGSYNVNDSFVVRDSQQVVFTDAILFMQSPCAKIVIDSGGSVVFNTGSVGSNDVRGCVPWQGIWVNKGGSLSMAHTTLKDAYIGVMARNGGEINIDSSCNFEDNYCHVAIANPFGEGANARIVNSNFGNAFKLGFPPVCAHSFVPQFPDTAKMIYIENVFGLSDTIRNNSFIEEIYGSPSNPNNGIEIHHSGSFDEPLTIYNNVFDGNLTAGIFADTCFNLAVAKNAFGTNIGVTGKPISGIVFKQVITSMVGGSTDSEGNQFKNMINGMEFYENIDIGLVTTVSHNDFEQDSFGLVIAPHEYPITACPSTGAPFSINNPDSFTNEIQLDIKCNIFYANGFGIAGSGEMIDQGSSSEVAGNDFTGFDILDTNTYNNTSMNIHADILMTGGMDYFVLPTSSYSTTCPHPVISTGVSGPPLGINYDCVGSGTTSFSTVYTEEVCGQSISYKKDNASIKEKKVVEGIEVFPNPFNNGFTIRLSNPQFDSYGIEVYDNIGRRVYNGNLKGKEIEIYAEDWAAGLYIVKVVSEANSVHLKRIVKWK